MIRVMVHVANPIMRAGLESMLRTDSAFEVVDSFSDLRQNRQPDVLVLDDESVGEPLSEGMNRPAIVLLSNPASDTIPQALAIGVQGFLPPAVTANELIATVGAVAQGLVVLHPDFEVGLTAIALPILPNQSVEPLTARELEVLQMLALGLGNKEIASRLLISEHTVKFHISSIFSKLNASSRTEAVTLGLRQGLILL